MKFVFTHFLVMPILWTLFTAVCVIFFIGDLLVWLLTFWWDKRLFILHKYSTFWALFHIWVNPFWKIDFEGKQHANKRKTYVIVSNHQSAFDIVLLYRINMHFKWVAKRELFRVPFIGWNLWLNRHILIDRASIKGAKKMLLQSQENLSKGNSVLIFPEGTRSKDGTMKRFKDGAFVLAKKTNTTILPIVINGSKEVFLKKGYVIRGSQKFKVKILPEITPEMYKDKTAEDLGRLVHSQMITEHKAMAPEYYE